MFYSVRSWTERQWSRLERRPAVRSQKQRARLHVEELEDRCLLTATPIVTYHGGPLLPNVQVEAIFWGWDPANLTGTGVPGTQQGAIDAGETSEIMEFGGNATYEGGANGNNGLNGVIPNNAAGFVRVHCS